MVSASTARLVEGAVALGAAELVHIKGTDRAIHAQRLLSMSEERRPVGRAESKPCLHDPTPTSMLTTVTPEVILAKVTNGHIRPSD